MKSYEEYKYSGVEWIGEIPKYWNIKPLRYLIKTIQTGSTPSTSNEEFYDGEIKWFTPGDFTESKYLNKCKRNITKLAIEKNETKLLPKDTVLLVGIGATLGKVAMLDEEASYNQQITGIVSNDNLLPQYLYYWLKMNTKTLLNISNFTTLPIVNNEFIKSFPVICPSIEEQEAIVNYLDKKNLQIDTLINKKEELIETLKILKQKIISDAVTKGINKDVEMKYSGIEWIGEIPRHWEKTKLKYITNKIIDGTHHTPNYTDRGVPFLRVTDITQLNMRENIDLNNVNFISEKEHKELIKRCKPEKGDLLLSKNGTIGITKVVDWDYDFSIFVSLCLIKPMKDKLYNRFCDYFFKSSLVNEQISIGGKTSTITNLHLEKIKDFFIFLPTLNEQKQIVKYLDSKVYKLESLISKIEEQIYILNKTKQKLITEVVTGKIDVRDYKLD